MDIDTAVSPPVEPKVPARGNVAVKWSGVITTLVAFLGALRLAIADDGISLEEWVTIGETTVIGAAVGFGLGTFAPTKR